MQKCYKRHRPVLSIVIGCTEILVFCHKKQQFWHLNKVVTVIAASFMRDLQAKNNKVMGRSWQSRLCWIEAVVQSSKYPVTALQRRAVPGCHLEMCDRKSVCQPEIEGQMLRR